MHDVTQILSQIEAGDPLAADKLLPLVYDELRKLAAVRLAHENPGQTLQATALVHEAYLRLVGSNAEQTFDHRGHFFAAGRTSGADKRGQPYNSFRATKSAVIQRQMAPGDRRYSLPNLKNELRPLRPLFSVRMIGIYIEKCNQVREQSVPILSQIEGQEIETAHKVSCPNVS